MRNAKVKYCITQKNRNTWDFYVETQIGKNHEKEEGIHYHSLVTGYIVNLLVFLSMTPVLKSFISSECSDNECKHIWVELNNLLAWSISIRHDGDCGTGIRASSLNESSGGGTVCDKTAAIHGRFKKAHVSERVESSSLKIRQISRSHEISNS